MFCQKPYFEGTSAEVCIFDYQYIVCLRYDGNFIFFSSFDNLISVVAISVIMV